MSFAATLALVAGYQHGLPWMSGGGKTRLAAKIALWGGREIAGLLLVSLLAGAATIPYIAYHFHRISPYGVIANLVAMPAVSVWVMPAGIFGLMSMPLGVDGFWWRVMGQGIDWMISVAQWVASFPGALGRVAAFGTGPMLLASAGLVVLCLLKTPLRFIGGCRRAFCWNSMWRNLQRHEVIESSGEVNWLIDGPCGERLPAIDLAHVDLTGGEQRPEQHGGSLC